MRLCAQCGDQIVPDEAANAPGVSRCAECGAYRLPAQQMTAAPPTPDPQGPPPGVEEGEAYVRVERVGPFVFRQYGRSYRTNGGPGCGCGCLLLFFMLFLMLRGFFSLF